MHRDIKPENIILSGGVAVVADFGAAKASLRGATPASRYRPSPRPYPTILPAVNYPTDFLVKDITAASTFRPGDRLCFLSNAVRHYPVGLEEVDDGLWSVYFCHVLLARINERSGTLTRG